MGYVNTYKMKTDKLSISNCPWFYFQSISHPFLGRNAVRGKGQITKYWENISHENHGERFFVGLVLEVGSIGLLTKLQAGKMSLRLESEESDLFPPNWKKCFAIRFLVRFLTNIIRCLKIYEYWFWENIYCLHKFQDSISSISMRC